MSEAEDRALARAAARAAEREAKRAQVLAIRDRETGTTTAADRRAARLARGPKMTGWVRPDGTPFTPVGQQRGISLAPGDVVLRVTDLTDQWGTVHPTIECTPGSPYTAGVTVTEDTCLGLQWVNEDGTPGDIEWARRRRGRLSVTGVAPGTAKGCRMLLACFGAPATFTDKDPETKQIMRDLRQSRRAQVAADADN